MVVVLSSLIDNISCDSRYTTTINTHTHKYISKITPFEHDDAYAKSPFFRYPNI